MIRAGGRSSDPETSKAAAAALDDATLSERRRALLLVLQTVTTPSIGMSDELIRDVYDNSCYRNGEPLPAQSDSGLRTRRSELVQLGYVIDTGDRMPTRSGRMAICWGAA